VCLLSDSMIVSHYGRRKRKNILPWYCTICHPRDLPGWQIVHMQGRAFFFLPDSNISVKINIEIWRYG
ncbi:MAG: hypothetical protein Q4E68_04480, partial [Prevotellaceae bacterium]|nr:hypothetical protein [Prevotellaceae bacterium]